ncbi:MAG: oligopeptide/dipeptide ABC transporter ATP-binding protein [Streptosporangiaceae bacterium]
MWQGRHALNPPSGCRFRTRCPLATDRCVAETPVLAASAGRHAVACHYPLDIGAVRQGTTQLDGTEPAESR